MSDCLFEIRPDGVGLITLNRPDSLNAFGGKLIPTLGEYLQECSENRAVRCVALTGAGRAFSAGGDVKGMVAGQDGRQGDPNFPAMLESSVARLRRAHDQTSLMLHTMPKPTVALVNGPAAGAGMSLALACDIRFCSDKAKFVPAFGRVGFSGDFGGSYFLQRLVGSGRAREIYFLGEFIDSQRALELGIANDVVPDDGFLEKGLEFCTRLAKGPTASYGRMKANFNFGESSTLKELLDQEALNMELSGMGRDFTEGTKAFVEKREPNFVGE
jgi:2-(1,2-epoxy-1,2-dihydrophenyl)acetyl-CoA isomerase